jgi:hypothetical protein
VLLSDIHLMRTGEVEANLVRLNEDHKLPYIADRRVRFSKRIRDRGTRKHPNGILAI